MSIGPALRSAPPRRASSDVAVAFVIGLGMVVVYMPRAWAAVDMSLVDLLAMTADVFLGWVVMGLLIAVLERGAARVFGSPWRRTVCVVAAAAGVRVAVPMSLQVLDATRHTVGAAPGAMRLELIWTTILCAAGTTVYLDRAASRQAADASLASLHREQQEVRRRLVEARLQVLQARVDPQLFFEMLGGVRDRYADDPAAAEALLERLTIFLRAALPRLRTPMSTLAQEAALASAYVDLLREARRTAAALEVDLAAAAAPLAFPAGVLLPLLDALLQSPPHAPQPMHLRLRGACGPLGGITLSLTGWPTAAPPAVDGVRRTLQAVYAAHASLGVRRAADGCWRIAVELHDASNAATGPRALAPAPAPLEPYPVQVIGRSGADGDFEQAFRA